MAGTLVELHLPVHSLFARNDGLGSLGFKVLNARSTGRPLVLIHGFSAVGLLDWQPLATELSVSRPVLIFDNRGMGGSILPKEREGDDFTVTDLANDVVELVKHIGWKSIDVLGFSMGGMIAQVLSTLPHLPFKINHLVLCATSAKAAHSDLLGALPQPKGPIKTLADKMELVRDFVGIGYDPAFRADPKNKELLERRLLESVSGRRPQKTMAKQLGVIQGYDVRKDYAKLASTPVLIIHGHLDKSVYWSEQKYVTAGIPHAEIAVLPHYNFGHSWYDYDFAETAVGFSWSTLLTRYLDDLPAAPIVRVLPKAKL